MRSREPAILRGVQIASPFFLAPINPGLAVNGSPTPRFCRFFERRSGNGIGICYVGNVAISPDRASNSTTATIKDTDRDTWSSLAAAISCAGSLPGIQLACGPSSANPSRAWVGEAEAFVEAARSEILSMPGTQLETIVSLFVRQAQVAVEAGFRVIQIHAAHGYLLAKLLSRRINCRSDQYGDDPLFILDLIVSGVRDRCPDALLDVRVSRLEGLEEREEDRYRRDLILRLARLNIDIISLTNGVYDVSKRLIYPSAAWGHAPFVASAVPYARQAPDKVWNVCGNIWNPALIDLENLPSNLTFSVGRALIADPALLGGKWERNREPLCNRCDQCHYYSCGRTEVFCPRNPDL